jgi:hypothetical protein
MSQRLWRNFLNLSLRPHQDVPVSVGAFFFGAFGQEKTAEVAVSPCLDVC